ncbi:hypothetical protein TL16_g11000 [Triparma laevis f. inornata]|uniref:phosphatidyl-N-methylethanolamine N-methyltransferase n=2 Tax=Triparma laevis TaxID=1534972 RepID=A0A9W7AB37_9STRA|nr:hypothetical protein TrLO_g8927 [Triparma laevis f. longispina]GMH87906.1 hypothetical protein TL16_g11000 [Triparma laevis f. inornata]
MFHKNPLNNLAHYLTSPLGLLGFFGCLNRLTNGSRPSCIIASIYLFFLSMDFSVPKEIFIQTAIVVISVVVLSCRLQLNIRGFTVLLALGYGLQDLSHFAYSEPTFQSATWGSDSTPLNEVVGLFFQHVFYLTPLVCAVQTSLVQNFTYVLPLVMFTFGCYAIDSHSSGLPHTFVKVRALFGKFTEKEEIDDMKTVRGWAMEQKPPKGKTSHWWVSDLDPNANEAFHRLEVCQGVKDTFAQKFDPEKYNVDVVGGMNELYISGPNRAGTSDQVFFSEHIDGPYILFPFASIYRCIVGLDMNTEISTIFPNLYDRKTAQVGDILAFDFNREPHLIAANRDKPNKDFRVVLKLHYCVYPKSLSFFGHLLHWLTTRYNELFRALFLFTLTPSTGFSKFVGEYAVNGGTVLYNGIDKYFGTVNILYIFTACVVSKALESWVALMLTTHFIHYCRYIGTYYFRKNVNWAIFKRDVLFFKSCALMQFCYMIMTPIVDSWKKGTLTLGDMNWVGFGMIAVGYFISISATAALGVDGTYFGIELGFVKADYQFVKSFPYNVLPHPMILSQVFALLGMHTFAEVGGAYPWLVPVHCAFYFTHMTQEIFDYHDGIPWYKR